MKQVASHFGWPCVAVHEVDPLGRNLPKPSPRGIRAPIRMDRMNRGLSSIFERPWRDRSSNGPSRSPPPFSLCFSLVWGWVVDRVPSPRPRRSSRPLGTMASNHTPRAFVVPQVEDNAEGWGPCSVPDHLKDLPYAPFNKADKIGRAADFSGATYGKAHYGASCFAHCTKAERGKGLEEGWLTRWRALRMHRTKPGRSKRRRSKRTDRFRLQPRLPRR